MTGEEIRLALTAFAARWSVYDGSERAEAQTFLNELFECYGTHRGSVADFEKQQAGRFVDLIWPGVCLIEMKAPSEAKKLEKHRKQVLDYWSASADPATNTPAPRWMVLCAFRKLEIWEPGQFPGGPRLALDLIDLPDQYDALMFLAGSEPVFTGGQAALTREAVVHLVDLYEQLSERQAEGPDVLRDFLLQSVWCLFAEDLGQIPEHRFTQVIEQLIANPKRSSADDLGQFFDWLNKPGERPAHGLYQGTPYANGGLFQNPARVHLTSHELEHLRSAAQFQWKDVQPSIFGSLLEGGLGHDQQWRLGAHYTHEADIQKVVQPTIVEPWRERIENLESHYEAVAAQNELLNYVVLDPACGSGNFLYVAYRELRRIEKRLHEREVELRKKEGQQDQGSLSIHFPLQNMRGIEIEGFAVALARVTLWMGHKLSVNELHLDEATLPLGDLSGIVVGDALRIGWPAARAIIGNPPFHGSQQLRSVLGDEYVEWLKREFSVGVKDYCVYWIRKGSYALSPGDRAGLVATNSVSQNRARGASLDYVVSDGGVITNAVSSQDWPGEAAVDVSIVNWVKCPAEEIREFVLDGEAVAGISTSLRPTDLEVAGAARLPQNKRRSFQGPQPVGKGFVLEPEEAQAVLQEGTATYRDVIRPYLIGDDIMTSPTQAPSRFVIDFGLRTLEQASQYPAALDIVRKRVKPERDLNRRRTRREKWWLLGELVPAMRTALSPLDRYVAGTATGTRIQFCWCDPWWCPSNATNVFAFSDDAAIGVLTSTVHTNWAQLQSSTLEDRIRYTPTSAFETFPWPAGGLDEVADVAERLYSRRAGICLERDFGLTRLYNEVAEGAWADLRDLHRDLDEAVARSYGWPAKVAHVPAESNRLLLELNRSITENGTPYSPF